MLLYALFISRYTNAAGIMVGEAILANPSLFQHTAELEQRYQQVYGSTQLDERKIREEADYWRTEEKETVDEAEDHATNPHACSCSFQSSDSCYSSLSPLRLSLATEYLSYFQLYPPIDITHFHIIQHVQKILHSFLQRYQCATQLLQSNSIEDTVQTIQLCRERWELGYEYDYSVEHQQSTDSLKAIKKRQREVRYDENCKKVLNSREKKRERWKERKRQAQEQLQQTPSASPATNEISTVEVAD